MQYPLYVHRDGATGFRASFSDFPGPVARGDSFDELKCNAQQIIESMYNRSEQLIPAPTFSMSALQLLDMDDGHGIWIFIDINLARVTSSAVSVQFSLPECVLERVDAEVKARQLTRSMFFTAAAVRELENRREG